MRLWIRQGRHRRKRTEQWERLDAAEAEAAELAERVDRVATKLLSRHRRNHWSESIDAILKGMT